MSLAEWPAALPSAPLRENYGEEPERNAAEYRPDAGPPKSRPRSIIAGDSIDATFLLTGAELDLFWNFYGGTLHSGVLPFRMPDARTGQTCAFAFAAPPRARARAGMQDRYELAVVLRRMP